MSLFWLNQLNGACEIEKKYWKKVLETVDEPIGIVMGSAYGGSIEDMGLRSKGRGKVYGFDTFEDLHPKFLANDPASIEAMCMDYWYLPQTYGTDALAYDYQRRKLDEQGLDNVILVKGMVNHDSCNDIPYINYAFLDMDIPKSMSDGYEAIGDKLVSGGYLLLHDYHNISGVMKWANDAIRTNPGYDYIEDVPASYIIVFQKK